MLLPFPNSEGDPLVVGGQAMMQEVSNFMEEKDVVATSGVAYENKELAGDKCIILTTLTRQTCERIIEQAKLILDEKLKV